MEIREEYVARGCDLIELGVNSKAPTKEGWRPLDLEDVIFCEGNLGWLLGEDDAVIDVDPRNGGAESFERLVADLGLTNLVPTVLTAGGGQHYYTKLPADKVGEKFSKKLRGYEGIDFLTKGAYVLIAGSEINGKPYTLNDATFGGVTTPRGVLSLASKPNSTVQDDSELGDFAGIVPVGSDTSEETVKAVLRKIDPDIDYEDWCKVGMALHSWHPVDGLALWDTWSSKGEKYAEGECEKKWNSFETNGGVTLGSIFHLAQEVDKARVAQLVKQIEQSNLSDLEGRISRDARKLRLSTMQLDLVAQAIQARVKTLSGKTLSIATARKLITPDRVVSEQDWCSEWLYSTHFASFINRKDRTIVRSEAFNVVNGRFVPPNENGRKQSAVSFVSDNGLVEHVHSTIYAPGQADKEIVNYDGHKCFNTFDPDSVPTVAAEYTRAGRKAVEVFTRHINLLCNGNEQYTSILIQWLAHNVQHKGVKLNWSPVIQSIQGVGKSYIGTLLRAVLGNPNVGTVNSDQVRSQFNSWAVDVCVNVLEELRVQGQNRYEIVNALKPLITDRAIQINSKGLRQYSTMNTCNYICFTNFKDALPMDTDDRRWFVIFTNLATLDDIEVRTGISKVQYFDELWQTVDSYENTSQIAKFLNEVQITAEFKALKQAPATEYKQMMIDNENFMEGLSEVKSIIDAGVPYVTPQALSSQHLFEELSDQFPDLLLSDTEKGRLLRKLGYVKSNVRKMLDGKRCYIWSTVPVTKELVESMKVGVTND